MSEDQEPWLLPRPAKYPEADWIEVSQNFGDSRFGIRTFVPRSSQLNHPPSEATHDGEERS